MSDWMRGGTDLDTYTEEPTSPRTMTKCAWRVSRTKPWPSTVEELMERTMQIKRAFYLDEHEHRIVCEEAFRLGERLLAEYVYHEDFRRSV